MIKKKNKKSKKKKNFLSNSIRVDIVIMFIFLLNLTVKLALLLNHEYSKLTINTSSLTEKCFFFADYQLKENKRDLETDNFRRRKRHSYDACCCAYSR